MKKWVLILFLAGLVLFLNGAINLVHFSLLSNESTAFNAGRLIGSILKPLLGIFLIIRAVSSLKLADQ